MQYICVQVGLLDTNCYILFDDNRQGVVVDPGGNSGRILNIIKQHGLNILYVLLTHVHFDHFLAAGDVIRSTGAKLLVPKDDETALTDPGRSLISLAAGGRGTVLKSDRVLCDGDEITAGELKIKALSTPGHTPGSSCYICGDLLLSGDTLFSGSIGRTDFPGGSFEDIRQSLEKLKRLKGDYTVLPGHGPSTTLSAEKTGNPYMSADGFDY